MTNAESVSEVSKRFVASDHGINWLEQNPFFLDLVEQFENHGRRNAEKVFEGNPYIGMGNHSEVWDIGGIAIKIATPTTGRGPYRYNCTFKPEDLVGQFTVLKALGEYLEDNDELSTPLQYFALSTRSGNIRAEQYMTGWKSLFNLGTSRHHESDKERYINETVRSRIREAIGDTALKLGIRDLGIYGKEMLHSRNVLVPEDVEAPESGPICIIDQPSKGVYGKLASTMLAARSKLKPSRQTKSEIVTSQV